MAGTACRSIEPDVLPDAAEIESAAAALRAGEVVAFPTETVYGLGAGARDAAALARVFELKRRPRSHPLIVHLHDAGALPRWTLGVTPAAQRLAECFWPGPLTLVLPRAADVSDLVTGGQATVALRVPAHPVARSLLAAFGDGIAAPSANRYGHVSPTRAEHVREEFGTELQWLLDGGDCDVGLESTIVDCSSEPQRLLRPGSITLQQLREVVPDIEAGAAAGSPRVPGSAAAHYAPGTTLVVVPDAALEDGAARLLDAGQRVAVLARRAARRPLPGCDWLQAGADAARFGHDLYASLRALDRLGAARLLVQAVPDGDAWDAVRDRLRRASDPGAQSELDEALQPGVLP